jgi:hypothetical protein
MATALTLIATLIVALQSSPDDPAKKSAQQLAQMCGEATVKNDVEKLIDLTHPKAVALMGGRDRAIKLTREAMKKMETEGVKMVSLGKVLAPEKIYPAGESLYCAVPVSFHMTIDDSKVLLRSALIGVSGDSGKTWKFVDISRGEKLVRELLPDMPAELKFPPKPTATRENEGTD